MKYLLLINITAESVDNKKKQMFLFYRYGNAIGLKVNNGIRNKNKGKYNFTQCHRQQQRKIVRQSQRKFDRSTF